MGLVQLQDESARTAFISGVYKTCLERQRKLRESASLTDPELGQYCLCYGRAIADIIDAREFEAIRQARAPRQNPPVMQGLWLSMGRIDEVWVCRAEVSGELVQSVMSNKDTGWDVQQQSSVSQAPAGLTAIDVVSRRGSCHRGRYARPDGCTKASRASGLLTVAPLQSVCPWRGCRK
jgi:hypothetical protein